MAAYALRTDNAGLAGILVESDGLMASVLTGTETATATYAFHTVYFRINHSVAVEA